MFYSPLRYPGGKNKLAAFLAKICIDNNINGHYVEPYSGGASVALFLLMEGYVNNITINDKDRSIYAFWYSVLNKTKELCKRIDEAELTIENWNKQKLIQNEKETADLLDLGFSTFFLNRTNRSGIIKAGVMGGIDQKGEYKIGCRFNKEELKNRILAIAKYKKKIRLYKKDAIKLINKVELESINENVIFYFDPPYYLKAESLYMNHYQYSNHKYVSDRIAQIKNISWVVSYDNNPNIQELYKAFALKEYSFNHSAYQPRVGQEVLFFSSKIKQPKIENYNPIKFKLIKKNSLKEITYNV